MYKWIYVLVFCILFISCEINNAKTLTREKLKQHKHKYVNVVEGEYLTYGLLNKAYNYSFSDGQTIKLKNNSMISFTIKNGGYPDMLTIDGVQSLIIGEVKYELKPLGERSGYIGDLILDDEGNVLMIWLNSDKAVKVGNIAFTFAESQQDSKSTVLDPLIFYKNGNIKEGTLAEGVKVFNAFLPKGTRIVFNRSGRVKSIFLNTETLINEKIRPAKTKMYLHDDNVFREFMQ